MLTGECIELVEGELPYAPIVRMLRSLDPDELSELAGTGRAELSPLIPEAIEAAEPRPDEQFAQGRMFDLLLTVFGRLGETGPLVLVIEDLHWGDRSTRDFLAFLVRALRSERLVLVATYRSDELHRKHPLRPLLAEFERLGRAERVELRRFSRPSWWPSSRAFSRSSRRWIDRCPLRPVRGQPVLRRGAAGRAEAATAPSPRRCATP